MQTAQEDWLEQVMTQWEVPLLRTCYLLQPLFYATEDIGATITEDIGVTQGDLIRFTCFDIVLFGSI